MIVPARFTLKYGRTIAAAAFDSDRRVGRIFLECPLKLDLLFGEA